MKTPIKIAGYVAGLAVVFAAALWAGGRFDFSPQDAEATPDGAHDDGHGGDHDTAADDPPGGLQIAQDGYRLVPESDVHTGGDYRFHIEGPDGAPVTEFTTEHDADLHLIVARRDLTGYQHLHPELADDGTWSTPLDLPEPGQYRVFADFAPAGAEGLTLGADLAAPGDHTPADLPEPAAEYRVDDYTVTLDGDVSAGTATSVTLSVSLDGEPVTDLEPYLGAYGHLVALRGGDLAYLHVHPEGTPGDGETTPGPEVGFQITVPSPGDYRLFLDFKHDGEVRTAEFTLSVPPTGGHPDDTPSGDTATESPSGDGHEGDDDGGHGH
ncbi:hypothetical protein [Stackebrandtia albiflava]|uniref:hypothetical protein n=1 Tax=Stackebrandtia albiflava TaxID=406432 RepID=UPI001B85F5CC|nr:hypothetical protein [Stackebrandtia albiflava]